MSLFPITNAPITNLQENSSRYLSDEYFDVSTKYLNAQLDVKTKTQDSLTQEESFIVFKFIILTLLKYLYPKLFNTNIKVSDSGINMCFESFVLLYYSNNNDELRDKIYDEYSKALGQKGGSSKKYIKKTKKKTKKIHK